MNFYRFDLSSVVIIFLTMSFVFLFLNYNNDEKNYTENILLSFIFGFFISLIYSYFTIEPDVILTTNFWE